MASATSALTVGISEHMRIAGYADCKRRHFTVFLNAAEDVVDVVGKNRCAYSIIWMRQAIALIGIMMSLACAMSWWYD